MSDTNLSGWDAEPGWFRLPEDQREAYRAPSETLRREAWAAYETAKAQGTLPRMEEWVPRHLRPVVDRANDPRYPFGTDRRPGFPRRPDYVTELKVFRHEQGHGVEWQEILRRWDTLTEGQRAAYEATATAARAAGQVEYRNGRNFDYITWLENRQATGN